MQSQIAETTRRFIESIMAGPKLVGPPLAVLASAFWYAFTSVLAWALAILFLADLFLGILRAIHRDGLDAFDWSRFWKAWIKMGAAAIGIVLFAIGDVLFHELGIPSQWFPLTTAALFGLCFGFFWSALNNFGHFFPGVKDSIERVIRKLNAYDPTNARRRTTDTPQEEET